MNNVCKAISLIVCLSIAVFAQSATNAPPPPQPQYQYPPQQQPPPQGQYQYPPPQQGQYQYPPPPQGQYQYPPPPQGQYQYPPPPQGQYQYPPPPQGQYQYPPPPQGQYQYPPPPPPVEQPAKQKVKQKRERRAEFGVRTSLIINDYSTGVSAQDSYYDTGMGLGVGVVSNFPITNILGFSTEASFLYRRLYNYSGSYADIYMSEFALSVIPVMLQVMPIARVPIYFAGAFQIDLPISPTSNTDDKSSDIDDRAVLDFGIVFSVGYRIIQHLEVDTRVVIGLTNIYGYGGDKSSLNQIGLGVGWFF